MVRRLTLLVCLVAVSRLTLADSGEPGFGLALSKLEHLISFDASIAEIEATYGDDDSFFGAKSELQFDTGSYNFSETQLYYSRTLGDRVSAIVGARHLDFDGGGDTSPMLGATATLAFDIELLILAFLNDDYAEGRFEIARTVELSPRIEMEPKIEFRTYSNDFETAAFELRLGYKATDCLKTYVGMSWVRLVGTSIDDDEFSALAGLSYEW